MTRAYRTVFPSMPVLTITPEEKRTNFIVYRNYTESVSLVPKKITLCATEEKERFGIVRGADAAIQLVREAYKSKERDLLNKLEPKVDVLKLTSGEYLLIDLLREYGLQKGCERFLTERSKQTLYRYKNNLRAKGVNIENADLWQKKAVELGKAIRDLWAEFNKDQDKIDSKNQQYNSWHEMIVDKILNEYGGKVLVAFIWKGDIYHKAFIKVSRYKITKQGFSSSEREYSIGGPRNIIFYP